MYGPERIYVGEDDQGRRLDVFLAEVLAERFSRSQVKKWIEAGHIKVGGRETAAHYRIKAEDRIEMDLPAVEPDFARAEAIPIDILYEDSELIVVNKPVGMVVHPAHGNQEHTLVNALLYHIKTLSNFKDPVRPGIVHRLDKDTSGVMVIAKNEQAHAYLARQFKDHSIQRVYHVVVKDVVQHDEGIIEEPVGRAFLNRKKVIIKPAGGKKAITCYRVMKRFARATLLEIRPRTGRTHQIRVHMAHMGHPVLGDSLYGVKSPLIERQALHALALGFRHPKTREKLYFEAHLPEDMQNLITFLEAQRG